MRAALLNELAEVKAGDIPRRNLELPFKEEPLDIVDNTPEPEPGFKQVLIRVEVCGVCYTDIDIIEGRVKCKIPLILGHQVVGRVEALGLGAGGRVGIGERVGVAWIGWSCGECKYCTTGLENLCNDFKSTGCSIDGGYAEYAVAYEDYVYIIPRVFESYEAAPLLCAGSVGYRALKLAGMADGLRLGFFGFGASAHILIQVARRLYPSSEIYVFSRSSNHRELALRLGADWVGHPLDTPPKKLDRAIDFTPVGETVPKAMEVLDKGGRLVINVIRKQTPVNLDYVKHMWMEREVKTVANVSRRDVEEFLGIAANYSVKPEVTLYKLEQVNEAIRDLKKAVLRGSAVLKVR